MYQDGEGASIDRYLKSDNDEEPAPGEVSRDGSTNRRAACLKATGDSPHASRASAKVN
jgi:hypothetical protein